MTFVFSLSCQKELISPTNTCNGFDTGINSSHSKFSQLNNILEEAIAERVPGVTVFIDDDEGRIVHSKGFADLEKGELMLPCHITKLGSVTKMMMGTVLWKIIEEGLISLDEPINTYIPDVASKITNGNEITVRMLVNHTSGIHDIARDIGFNLAVVNDFTRSWSGEEILKFIENKPSTVPPGTELRYSNSNTLLLSLIIESIKGVSHESLLEEYIFNPLGMDNTFYYDYSGPFPSDYLAQGYLDFNNDNKAIQNISLLNPGSGNGFTGVYSNVYDMYTFMDALLRKRSLLKEESINAILSSFELAQDGSWASSDGAIHDEHRKILSMDIHAYGHAGGDVGYSANLNYFPHNNTILAACYNYGTNLPSSLGDRLNVVRNEVIKLAAE